MCINLLYDHQRVMKCAFKRSQLTRAVYRFASGRQTVPVSESQSQCKWIDMQPRKAFPSPPVVEVTANHFATGNNRDVHFVCALARA